MSAIWIEPCVELAGDAVQQLVRHRREPVGEAQLVEQREGGRVDGVAAKIAQEVGVLLQHGDLDPGTGHQQAEDHPGGTTADDEAGRALAIRHALNLAPIR